MEFKEKYLKLGVAVAAVAIPLALIGVMVAIKSDRQPVQQHAAQNVAPQAVTQHREPGSVIAQIASPQVRTAVEHLYATVDGKLMWSGDGAAQRRLRDVTDEMDAIAAQGLDVSKVTVARDALAKATPADAAKHDVAMTEQVLAMTRALRFGQVPAARIEDWHVAGDTVDIVPELAAALKSTKVSAFLRTLSPAGPAYTDLVKSLARYRALDAAGGWPQIESEGELKIDLADPRMATLQRRLTAEGYFAANMGLSKSTLMEALKSFQARNGLEPDGRIGKGTLAALNVTAQSRVGQILANLERQRHLSRAVPENRITVNTADQSLVLYTDGAPALRLRTIVGDRKHPTPMLSLKLAAVTLNPTWEIPPSIASKEILPHLKRDPAYLAKNEMVVVDGPADPQGLDIDWHRYSAMPWRLRQLAGAQNALGELKFEMWNSYNIYLHDTPGRHLFAKADRYMSHGCVRVDQSRELARRVLNQEEWNEETLAAAIATGGTKMIRLKQAIPVQILYWTAFVDDAGELQFRPDAYRRDAPLAEELGYPPQRAATHVASREQ